MEAVGKSVQGLIRPNNEDSFYISCNEGNAGNLYIVADGMGGHNAGEVASKKAIEYFIKYLKKNHNKFSTNDVGDLLVEGIAYSNQKIYEKSISKEKFEGMGTTFTCAVILEQKLIVVHVGDSRAYLFNKANHKQITTDHSYVMEMVKQGKITLAEAEDHPKRNVITRAIGTKDDIVADVFVEKLKDKDIILLCSDGLTTMVKDEKIEEIINNTPQLEVAADKLVEEANINGGKDNITIVLIRFEVEE